MIDKDIDSEKDRKTGQREDMWLITYISYFLVPQTFDSYY